MKLKHPFPRHKRELFRDVQYTCWVCGQNGSNNGGMEAHHILSRVSGSVFNLAPVCKKCHSKMGHTFEEHKMLLEKTARYVVKQIKLGNYKPDYEDEEFLEKYKKYYI